MSVTSPISLTLVAGGTKDDEGGSSRARGNEEGEGKKSPVSIGTAPEEGL